MNCQTERMAQGGRSMARIDGKVTFIEGALPGERVEIAYQKQKKDFDEARCVRVLEPHASRVAPACPLYEQCGGCNMQHASIDLQRQLKRDVVNDLFRRMAKQTLPENWVMHGGKEWGYRQRVRFIKGSQAWGFRRAESHQIVPIASCPVLCDALNAGIAKLPALPQQTELQVFADTQGQLGLYHKDQNRPNPTLQSIQILGKTIVADARVFFQSNFEMMPALVQSVLDVIPKGSNANALAVDLFSGVGVFAAFLQDHFERVIAVEWNEGCLAHARANLGKNCEFHSASAETYLGAQVPQGIDFLVVDPPRAGLSPEVRKALIQAHPKRMVYVSCDPVTLARDTGEFVRNGFTLESVQGFDFYPQTDHLEMMAVFR